MTIYYTVYRTTCLVNHKIYVGVHKTANPNDRYLGSGLHLNSAIKKHGRHNFKKEILHLCETKEEAYRLEKSIVNREFIGREDTYNMNLGGDCPPQPTEKSRVAANKAMWEKYRNDPIFAERIRAHRQSQVNPMQGRKQLRACCVKCRKDLPVNQIKTHQCK